MTGFPCQPLAIGTPTWAVTNFTDQKFLELRQKGYLPAIYAHLMSLTQVERLVSLKQPTVETGTGSVDEKTAEPIQVLASETIQ
ncbi:MAG: SapC family protein [Magnetococcales bacterium]|nr:SapC family protein [Magnetococcales bacterium]